MFQQFELRTYPGPPDSVDASMDGGNMDVQVTIGGESVTISVAISVPDTVPGPAIIDLGGNGLSMVSSSSGSETTGIDTTKLGVTGCSSNGKGAFFIGALVDRITHALPQESGAAGAAS
ncbi:hypothetical protein DL764_003643 [Monosporascus ibericus]|uniref:(4-O-methyl)-D-glucuronate--lignin esterase n=1 Tax=Monosporascus ibericus TaxID=155417 RepID=A0A4Q4TK84_9PEZI|nr:hypothetical protein DL764_003643 [Monosporascus ibericus]